MIVHWQKSVQVVLVLLKLCVDTTCSLGHYRLPFLSESRVRLRCAGRVQICRDMFIDPYMYIII